MDTVLEESGTITITQTLNPDDLAEGWRAMETLRPSLHVDVTVGAKTDLGSVRENNEDKYDMLEPREPALLASKGRLYGVADGMGGHSAGQIASEIALKTLIHFYFSDPSIEPEQSLRAAIEIANHAVHEDAQLLPERQGMGTTLTACAVRENKLHVIHVGDSRLYLVRDGAVRQVTEDHSWVAEQVRLGGMSIEEALASPYRNIILRSVGTGPMIEPDYFVEDLQEGDAVVICSDGLTGHIEESELAAFTGADVLRRIGPSVAAQRLVELANDRGGRDNITVVVLFMESIEPYGGD